MGVGLCFFMGWLSKIIGMSMAIGAFLMGVMISQSKFSGELREKTEPMKEVFMAVFFISVGMEVTFTGFVNSLPLAVGILLIFMISKFITVFIGYFFVNKSFEEGFVSSVSLMAMGEFAFIIASEAYSKGAVTENFYTAVICSALMSMILLPIIGKKMYAASDWLATKRPRPFSTVAEHAYSVRSDICARIESSPSVSYYAKRNLKNTYICLLLIILIEIVFVSLMESMTDFLAELIKMDGYDSHYVAYIALMVINFLLLAVPTYGLIRSVKSFDKLMVEGERRITEGQDEKQAAKIRSFYESVLSFSTLALVFVIDFLIMAVVPGPFGAEKSSLIVIPIAVAIFLLALLFSKRKKKKTAGQSEESEQVQTEEEQPKE